MSWILAFFIVAVVVVALVSGSVMRPVLYGLFIAVVLVVPLWAFVSIGNGIIDSIFGRRR